MAHYKKLSAIRRLDQSREDLISREEKDQAEEFMYILGAEWTTKVQTKAMKVLKERKEYKKTKLPSCQDMKTLAEHTTEALRKADLIDKSYSNFNHVQRIVQARLLMYNRRRSGKIDGLKLVFFTLIFNELAY